MFQIDKNLDRHGPLVDRFVGQIWDSGVDIYGIPDGVPMAITNNKIIQASLKKYLMWVAMFVIHLLFIVNKLYSVPSDFIIII